MNKRHAVASPPRRVDCMEFPIDWELEFKKAETRISAREAELQSTQLQLMQEETDRKIWQQDCKKAEAERDKLESEVMGHRRYAEKYYLTAEFIPIERHRLEIQQARQETARECYEMVFGTIVDSRCRIAEKYQLDEEDGEAL
jgi:multidrug resistance efflux pump